MTSFGERLADATLRALIGLKNVGHVEVFEEAAWTGKNPRCFEFNVDGRGNAQ